MLKAAWRSLLGRKLRLVMSTFAIVLGVSFVVGTLIFSHTLDRSFTAIFASTVGDVVVRPAEGGSVSGGEPGLITGQSSLPGSLVDRLAEVEGAARADGNVTDQSTFVIGTDGRVVGGSGAPGIGANYSEAPAGHGIVGLRIIAGDRPHGRDEVALDATTAEKAGYQIGDEVALATTGKQPIIHATLVGVADFAEGGSLNGATLSLFDTRTAQGLYLDGKDRFHDIWVTAEPGVSQAELRDRVAAVLPTGYEAVTGDKAADEGASSLKDAISFLTTFLLVFAGISLVVGAFLIVNTFSILVAQRSRELALLRALGASRRQLLLSVLLEAFVLGVLGSTLGALLGIGLAWAITQLFATFGLDLTGTPMVFRPVSFGAGYAVGTLVTVLAALWPAWRSTRIPPVAALRDDVALPQSALWRRMVAGVVLVAGGVIALYLGLFADRSGWFLAAGLLGVLLGVASMSPMISKPFLHLARAAYSRVFGSIGTLAGQNSLRNPRRTAATASALMIGLALCSTMAIAGQSAKRSVDESVAEEFLGDFVVSNVQGQPFSAAVGDRVEKVSGVATVSRLRTAVARRGDGQPIVLGIQPDTVTSALDLRMVEGSLADLDAHSVIVPEGNAEQEGHALGDRVELLTPRGPRMFDVVGISEDNSLIFSDFITTLGGLSAAGYPPVDSSLYIQLEVGADRAAALDGIEAATDDVPLVSVKDQDGLAAEARGTINQLILLVYGLLALALVIAVLGIVNTLGLSIIERTREVGLLRAIGVSRPQLWRMVTLESVVIAVLGALLGVLLGIGFGVAIMYDLRSEGLSVIAVPWDQLGAFLAAAVVIGVLAAVFPAVRAARLDVLRAIATE